MASLYKMPLTSLSGVGAKRAGLFEKLGVTSVGGLLNYYPKTDEDWSDVIKIREAKSGDICCVKAVLGTPIVDSFSRNGVIMSSGMVYDETGSLKVLFFKLENFIIFFMMMLFLPDGGWGLPHL